jgi:hypothetical protein
MAIVLLAFSVIPLDIMVADCNVRGVALLVPPPHTHSFDFLSGKYQPILIFIDRWRNAMNFCSTVVRRQLVAITGLGCHQRAAAPFAGADFPG